jgi:hypothetical protein
MLTRGATLLMTTLFVAISADVARADMNEVVSQLLKVCLAGGSALQLEADGKGEVALTLKALRTGQIGGNAGIAGKYSKTEWEGLMGGISSELTQLQVGEADKARECLKPYMPGIVQAILNSK